VSLIEAFWAESTPYQRRLLLDEASGRTSGGVTFEFDMFDVTLDFDTAVATIADAVGDEQSLEYGAQNARPLSAPILAASRHPTPAVWRCRTASFDTYGLVTVLTCSAATRSEHCPPLALAL